MHDDGAPPALLKEGEGYGWRKDRFTEVNEMASQLQQFNGQLRTCLDGISAKMRHVDLSWDSPAGAALQARFTELLPVFDRYEQVVEHYVSFLRQSVQAYQDAESLLRQQQRALRSDRLQDLYVCSCCRNAAISVCGCRRAVSAPLWSAVGTADPSGAGERCGCMWIQMTMKR